ncbi:dihydrofolate reductase family protein [Nakamurella sp. YIM 132084]|uniref:Dihydrofolate reductase family protein n=1 Tax=Nakamurella leprariae TaxID=2803911 RepID=A0A939C0B7_9ACTN|nr:dihydrofolate reductase family protein [Nakamurella leprariae]MBM9466002.1 dihydrofolate reductase family protein [Nakamurella leprariae]
MTLVIADITISLDGFVTGPDPDPEQGLGEDGDRLHAWALESDDAVDRGVLRRHNAASGAVVMGRNTFDIVDTAWATARPRTVGRRSSWSPGNRRPATGSPPPTTSPS